MGSSRPRRSTNCPKIFRERPIAIDPLSFDAEPGLLCHSVQLGKVEFMRGLGPDGLAGAEAYREVRFAR